MTYQERLDYLNQLNSRQHIRYIRLPGHLFSDKTQKLREQLEDWFKEQSLLIGYDVDFLYCHRDVDNLITSSGNYEYLDTIAVWFADPKIAMLFKLSFA